MILPACYYEIDLISRYLFTIFEQNAKVLSAVKSEEFAPHVEVQL